MKTYDVFLPNKELYDSNLEIEDLEFTIERAALSHLHDSLSRFDEYDGFDFSAFCDSCEVDVEKPETVNGTYNVYIKVGGYRKEYYECWGARVSRDEWQTIHEENIDIEVLEVQNVKELLG